MLQHTRKRMPVSVFRTGYHHPDFTDSYSKTVGEFIKIDNYMSCEFLVSGKIVKLGDTYGNGDTIGVLNRIISKGQTKIVLEVETTRKGKLKHGEKTIVDYTYDKSDFSSLKRIKPN